MDFSLEIDSENILSDQLLSDMLLERKMSILDELLSVKIWADYLATFG